MNYTSRTIAFAIAGVVALGPGAITISAQVSIDHENKYSNVGTIMVWRVDDAGKPVELRGFVSGTLIRDRVMVTAGHFTAPAKALGSLPPSVRMFASFSVTDAKDPKTWIAVVDWATHPSMPPCPPPPQCDPTDDILVAPLEPGVADVGLIFLSQAPPGIEPARLAGPGTLDRSEGASTTIVGYGTTTPRERSKPPDAAIWDGTRRIRISTVRRVVDETWALWSIPSYVCSGDSGGGIFLNTGDGDVLVANVSDGGRDCRRHNNNNRLDTRSIQSWIDDTLRQRLAAEAAAVESNQTSVRRSIDEGSPVVVFVCEHGSAKSIVAAAHFNHLAAQRGLAVRAVSRGTTPDAGLAPSAVTGLRSDGLTPSEGVPRKLQKDDLEQAARVVIFNDLPPELAGVVAVERWEVPPISTQYAASRDAMLAHIEELLDAFAGEP